MQYVIIDVCAICDNWIWWGIDTYVVIVLYAINGESSIFVIFVNDYLLYELLSHDIEMPWEVCDEFLWLLFNHCSLLYFFIMMWILTLLLEWCSMRHRSGTEDSGSGASHEESVEA